MVGLVEKRQQASEDADAVEGVPLGRKIRVGKGGVAAQDTEARRHGEDKRLEVGEVVVAGAANVCRREEREDVFGRLWQLPELVQWLAQHCSREADPYARPVGIICGDLLGLRQAEDALLEAEFGVGGAHWNACHYFMCATRGVVLLCRLLGAARCCLAAR